MITSRIQGGTIHDQVLVLLPRNKNVYGWIDTKKIRYDSSSRRFTIVDTREYLFINPFGYFDMEHGYVRYDRFEDKIQVQGQVVS